MRSASTPEFVCTSPYRKFEVAMGNSPDKYGEYEYRFESTKLGDFDLSQIRVFKVDDKRSESIARTYLSVQKILYVDCEGKCFGNRCNQQLGLIQVATQYNECYIFHVKKYPECIEFLRTIFEEEKLPKVFHDCSGDSSVLFYEYGICLRNVHDTQIAHKVIEAEKNGGDVNRSPGSSLSDLYSLYCNKKIPGNKRFNRNCRDYPGGNIWLDNKELTDGMIKYAALDALVLNEIFHSQIRKLSDVRKYRTLVIEQLKRKINFEEHHHFPLNIPDENSESWLDWIAVALAAVATAFFLTRR